MNKYSDNSKIRSIPRSDLTLEQVHQFDPYLYRKNGHLLFTDLMDAISQPSKAIPEGSEIDEDMIELINDLHERYTITRDKFRDSRYQYIAGMFHFAICYQDNEGKIDALLKKRKVTYNKGSNYWRKVALLWLNQDYNKSVATRYGQLMEYSASCNVEAKNLYESLKNIGISQTLSLLIKKMNSEKATENMPSLDQRTQEHFEKLFANNVDLPANIELNLREMELAPGAVSIEAVIEDDGNLQFTGIIQTSLTGQIERLESSYNKSKEQAWSHKDMLCLLKETPCYLNNAIGIQIRQNSFLIMTIGEGENAPFFKVMGKSKQKETLNWGLIARSDFDHDDVPKNLKKLKEEDVILQSLESGASAMTLKNISWKLNSFIRLDKTDYKIGPQISVKTLTYREFKSVISKIMHSVEKNEIDISCLRKALWGEIAENMNVVFSMKDFLETAEFIAKKSNKIVQCVVAEEGLQIKGYANGTTYSLHVKTQKS